MIGELKLMTIPTCSRYKKVTVITDPQNPEMDLVYKALSYGKVVAREECSDGFVYLILIDEAVTEIPSVVESEV
jgi:hypothetical protein